jgi:hypothetical protein
LRIRLFVPCAAVAVALGFGAPALASSQQAPPSAQGAAGSPDARTSLPATKSTKFAGYEINLQDGQVDIATTIAVPKLRCTRARRAIGASVGMFEDSKKRFSSANLFIGCVNGKARYFPFLRVHQREQNFPRVAAHPGDKVVLEAAATKTETTVSVTDDTHSFSKTKTGAGFSTFVGYPWIGDVTWSIKSRVLRVPNFGKIQFSYSTMNGEPFGSHTGMEQFDRYNPTRTVLQIKTGAFATDQESFSTFFKHF